MPSWLTASFAVIASVLTSVALNWLVGRKKEKREESGEERAEESQDIATVRGIASDTLARLTLAYNRLDVAETAATEARREATALREQVVALEGEVDLLRPRIKMLEEQHVVDREKIGELQRANRALDNDLKRLLDSSKETGGRV